MAMTKTLLAQRHYPLESTCFGRKIVLGILVLNDCSVKPVIRFQNTTLRGVVLGRQTFLDLADRSEEMAGFVGKSRDFPSEHTIQIGDVMELRFRSLTTGRTLELHQKLKRGINPCRGSSPFQLNAAVTRLFCRLAPCIGEYLEHSLECTRLCLPAMACRNSDCYYTSLF